MAKAQRRVFRSELVTMRLKASDRLEVYAGLLMVCRVKGRKPGFAAHKFKALFGEWPRFGTVEPCEPNSDLLTWLERERRRYGQVYKRERMKAEEAAKNASAAALARIEAILGELEANPLVRNPCCQEDTDCEALDLVCELERKRKPADSLAGGQGGSGGLEPAG